MKQGIINKIVAVGLIASALIVVTPSLAAAHVVVSPSSALTGEYETFTTSVPNEKEIPVTGLRLVIPDSIESVTPTVKPGWEIAITKKDDKVTEISWTGGSIPAEQRDEFTFSAHLPSKAGDITWKAYQTYQDGSVVAWDQKPSEDAHHEGKEGKGPYSVTTVSEEVVPANVATNKSSNIVLYVTSIVALALGVFALIRTSRK